MSKVQRKLTLLYNALVKVFGVQVDSSLNCKLLPKQTLVAGEVKKTVAGAVGVSAGLVRKEALFIDNAALTKVRCPPVNSVGHPV